MIGWKKCFVEPLKYLCEPLKYLFNLSIVKGFFPDDIKNCESYSDVYNWQQQ